MSQVQSGPLSGTRPKSRLAVDGDASPNTTLECTYGQRQTSSRGVSREWPSCQRPLTTRYGPDAVGQDGTQQHPTRIRGHPSLAFFRHNQGVSVAAKNKATLATSGPASFSVWWRGLAGFGVAGFEFEPGWREAKVPT